MVLLTFTALTAGEWINFRVLIGVDCRPYEEISVLIEMPNGQCFLPAVTPTAGGFCVAQRTVDSGTHQVRVLLNSINITGSPFQVEALPLPLLLPCDWVSPPPVGVFPLGATLEFRVSLPVNFEGENYFPMA